MIRILGAVLVLLAAGAHARAELLALAPAPVLETFATGSHERFAAQVSSAQSAEYALVLKAYDAHLALHPDAYLVRIERCRFVEGFAYSEENYIESAEEDLDHCRKALDEGPHKARPPVLLYALEHTFEEDAVTRAEKLLSESRTWPKRERVRLLELLSQRVFARDANLVAAYAMEAVELDPGSAALLTAVDRWVQLGAKETALRLLRNAPESTWEQVPRTTAAQTLIDLGDAKAAATLLRAAEKLDAEYQGNLLLARALAAANELDAARKLYHEAVKAKYVANDTRVELFHFELEHGTTKDAAAAYEELRDQGYWADPMARQRLGLLFAAPGTAWHVRDALGLLTLVGLLLLFFLVPLLVVVPVHYRGLARRVAGRAPDLPAASWQLRHAMYALGAFLLADYLALYIYAPQYLEVLLPGNQRYAMDTVTDLVLGKYLLLSILAGLVLVAPLMRARSFGEVLLGRWGILKHVLVGVGAGLALKLLAIIIGMSMQESGALGSDTTRAVQGVSEQFGLGIALLLVAGVTPIVEEFVFRGVLLQSFRAEVSFWFSAVLTSLTFTLLHEEWANMPFLFVFAMVAALLVRRSGGLLAPIVLHATNNAIAVLVIVGATDVLNR